MVFALVGSMAMARMRPEAGVVPGWGPQVGHMSGVVEMSFGPIAVHWVWLNGGGAPGACCCRSGPKRCSCSWRARAIAPGGIVWFGKARCSYWYRKRRSGRLCASSGSDCSHETKSLGVCAAAGANDPGMIANRQPNDSRYLERPHADRIDFTLMIPSLFTRGFCGSCRDHLKLTPHGPCVGAR